MHLPLFLCLYESFWKGFESDQRRLTLLVIKGVCREIKIHVYAKRQTWICTTWPSFPLIFRLPLYYFYKKISSFMPVLTIWILRHCFYLLIFYSEKFSTWAWTSQPRTTTKKSETSLFCKCVSWEKNWTGFKRKDGPQAVEVLAKTLFISDTKAYTLRRDFHIKVTGMLFVSPRGVNWRFWSHLWCLGRKGSIIAHLGIV